MTAADTEKKESKEAREIARVIATLQGMGFKYVKDSMKVEALHRK